MNASISHTTKNASRKRGRKEYIHKYIYFAFHFSLTQTQFEQQIFERSVFLFCCFLLRRVRAPSEMVTKMPLRDLRCKRERTKSMAPLIPPPPPTHTHASAAGQAYAPSGENLRTSRVHTRPLDFSSHAEQIHSAQNACLLLRHIPFDHATENIIHQISAINLAWGIALLLARELAAAAQNFADFPDQKSVHHVFPTVTVFFFFFFLFFSPLHKIRTAVTSYGRTLTIRSICTRTKNTNTK